MEELPIQFFLAFDANSIIEEMNLDLTTEEDKNKITLYSYKDKLHNDTYKILYENEMTCFEPNFQKAQHKEGSLIYHLLNIRNMNILVLENIIRKLLANYFLL